MSENVPFNFFCLFKLGGKVEIQTQSKMHIYEGAGSARYQIYSILVSKEQAEMSKISW